MLHILRDRHVKKNIFIILTVALVASFGISLVVVSQDDKHVFASLAKLDGRNITTQEYLGSYRAVQNQLRWMYGDKLNEIAGRVNLKGEAWDRLLLLAYAKKERIHA